MNIEDEIRKAIRGDSRTRKEIAAAAGMYEPNLSRFMTDKTRRLSVDTAESLAGVLGGKLVVEWKKKPRPRK